MVPHVTAPAVTQPKTGRRGEQDARRAALASPHKAAYTASIEKRWKQPETLPEYLKEFRSACDAEVPGDLHQGGVEAERITTSQVATAIAQGLPLPTLDGGARRGPSIGGPRWTHEFRAYLDAAGSPFSTYIDDHGEEQWAHPLRSSIKRMDLSKSGHDRSAAEFLYLLRRCRGNVHLAWTAQVGPLARTTSLNAATAWATECLRRWWGHYVERPRGRIA
jgi:hypothetical protein